MLQCIRFLTQHYRLHENNQQQLDYQTQSSTATAAGVNTDSELHTACDSVDATKPSAYPVEPSAYSELKTTSDCVDDAIKPLAYAVDPVKPLAYPVEPLAYTELKKISDCVDDATKSLAYAVEPSAYPVESSAYPVEPSVYSELKTTSDSVDNATKPSANSVEPLACSVEPSSYCELKIISDSVDDALYNGNMSRVSAEADSENVCGNITYMCDILL